MHSLAALFLLLFCFLQPNDDAVLDDRLQSIRQTIAQAAQAAGRCAQDIQLLAASKAQTASMIRAAYQAGLRDFGENYLQEALAKQQALADLPINWHFIGTVQSRKCALISQNFSWVHSVDREKTACLLNEHRPKHLPPLQICLQVNLDDEEHKSGVSRAHCRALAQFIHQLPQLTLRGLMALPSPRHEAREQYHSLLRLQHLQAQLNQDTTLQLDTLSMGTSDDLAAAVRAGSTIVRLGRALFGERI
ncbi:MAG: YggS family pyridoxal phosphate-dependent enzyme [Legionellaceae bacterium]|nr:YggS family pyridoxal phosphate-dependent enzyme [Legionellaceae bacterium]